MVCVQCNLWCVSVYVSHDISSRLDMNFKNSNVGESFVCGEDPRRHRYTSVYMPNALGVRGEANVGYGLEIRLDCIRIRSYSVC
jgi:hypothetical protein